MDGGNPNMLVELYKAGWGVDKVVKRLIISKGLTSFVRSLGREVRELLWRGVEDPTRCSARRGSAVGEAGRHKHADRLNNLPRPAAVDRPAPLQNAI